MRLGERERLGEAERSADRRRLGERERRCGERERRPPRRSRERLRERRAPRRGSARSRLRERSRPPPLLLSSRRAPLSRPPLPRPLSSSPSSAASSGRGSSSSSAIESARGPRHNRQVGTYHGTHLHNHEAPVSLSSRFVRYTRDILSPPQVAPSLEPPRSPPVGLLEKPLVAAAGLLPRILLANMILALLRPTNASKGVRHPVITRHAGCTHQHSSGAGRQLAVAVVERARTLIGLR